MLLALFGGTGRVGRRLLEYATEERHSVHALVRDPARCPAAIGAIPFQGDIADPDAVAAVLEGADGVLSSLGGAGLNAPGTAISRGMRNIVAGMRRHGVRRVLAVAGSGVLDDPRGGLRADAPDFPDVYRAITREHIGTFEALRQSGLDWTLVCCPDLVDGSLTRRFRTAVDVLPEHGMSISVEDVAGFMLDHVSNGTYVGRRVGLAY